MAFALPLLGSVGGVAGVAGTAAAVSALSNRKGSGAALLAPPAPPTIDDAAQNRDELDRIRRRRGVLSNVFTGESGGAAPTVGTKLLTGT